MKTQNNIERSWTDDVADMVRDQILERGIRNETLLEVIRKIPRHEFVPASHRHLAYADRALAIGYGQTVSQPYISALMAELLQLTGKEKVLEIGTGSGYQTAIIAKMCNWVYSLEINENLSREANQRLVRLGIQNITIKPGNGYNGWEREASFDRIIVTAAPETVPKNLIAQLYPDGRLVIPVGTELQELMVITKAGNKIVEESIIPVSFVPMVRV